jgi:hypothetical protein
MSEPNAYNKGLGSLFKFKNKLKQPNKFGKDPSIGIGGAGSGPDPYLDNYKQNLLVACSLRRLFSNYTGPLIVVQNGNGSATPTPVPQNANGELDTLFLQAWISANPPGPYRVQVWYDQNSLNNFTYVNVNLVNLPVIADASGNIYTNNGKPCIKFGFNNIPTILSANYVTSNAKYMVLSDVVQDPNPQNIVNYPYDELTATQYARGSTILEATGGTLRSSELNSTPVTAETKASLAPPTRLLLHSQHNTTTLKTDIYYNGGFVSAASTAFSGITPGISKYHIGGAASGDALVINSGFYFKGNMQEIIIYSQPQEIYISGLTGNIKAYWNL